MKILIFAIIISLISLMGSFYSQNKPVIHKEAPLTINQEDKAFLSQEFNSLVNELHEKQPELMLLIDLERFLEEQPSLTKEKVRESTSQLIARFEAVLKFGNAKELPPGFKDAYHKLKGLKKDENNKIEIGLSLEQNYEPGILSFREQKHELKEIPSDFFVQSRKINTSCNSTQVNDPDPSGIALTGSDSFNKRTSKILELASKLSGAEDAFEFVQKNISFLPRIGLTQTAEQVLLSEEGTAADKANLLISLLRAKGVAAQYVYGEVYLTEKNIKELYEVQGRNDLFWAHFNVIGPYITNSQGVKDQYKMISWQNGEMFWVLPHVWVRAHYNGEWVILDPTRPAYRTATVEPYLYYTPVTPDIDYWFFQKDVNNRYVKKEFFSEFMVKETNKKMKNLYGLSASDLAGFQKRLSLRNSKDAFERGTISSIIPCTEAASLNFNTNYSFKATTTLKAANYSTLVVTKELAEVSAGNLSLRHSSGLYSSTYGGAPGRLQLIFNGNEVSGWNIKNNVLFNVEQAVNYPPRYAAYPQFSTETAKNSFTTGGVHVIHYHLARINFERLKEVIDDLRNGVRYQLSAQLLMEKFLKLSGLYYAYLLGDIDDTISRLYSVTYAPLNLGVTYTLGGILKTKSDRAIGMVPLGAQISWSHLVSNFFRVGNYDQRSEYPEFKSNDGLVFIASGSQAESLIWEDLFGVPGASTARVLQEVSKLGAPVIRGYQFGNNATTDSQIYSQLTGAMRDVIPEIKTLVTKKQKPTLYSPKGQLTLPSGWSGMGYLLVTDNSLDANYRNIKFAPVNKGGGMTSLETAARKSTEGKGDFGADNRTSPTSCNPVVVSNGSMWHAFEDIRIRGRTPNTSLVFNRLYLSKSFNSSGDLGPNWVHSWETRLINNKTNQTFNPATTGDIYWINEKGSEYKFVRNSSGSYTPPEGLFDSLFEYPDRYEIVTKFGVVYTFARATGKVPPGKIVSIKDPHGDKIQFEYDLGKLARVSAPMAGTVELERDVYGKLISLTRSIDGLSVQFTYFDDMLASSRDLAGHETKYEYVIDRPNTAAQGLLSKITDPLDRTIEFDYYDNGQVFVEKGFAGETFQYIYSPFMDRVRTLVKVHNGTEVEYQFDEKFREIEAVYADQGRTQQTWDTNDNLLTSTDELGFTTAFTYDSKGNRTGMKLPEHSGFITTTYDQSFSVPTQVKPLVGSTVNFTIDTVDGDILRQTANDSVGPLNLEFERDQFGNLTKTTNGIGSFSNVYDDNGRLLIEYDSKNPITYTYDANNRVHTKSWLSGRMQSFSYDQFDRIVKVEDTHGPTVENTYDPVGRLVTKKISDGQSDQITRYYYDARDRLIKVVDPLGRVTQSVYDTIALGCKLFDKPRLIKDPAGRITKFYYDARSRLIKQVDPKGGVTTFEYNMRGDRTAVIDPEGTKTKFYYDGNRRVTKQARETVRTNDKGKPILATETKTFSYDQADRLVRKAMVLPTAVLGSEGSFFATEFKYDLLGRLTKREQKKELNGTTDQVYENSTFSYERILDKELILSAQNDAVKYDYTYDSTPPYLMEGYQVSSIDPSNLMNLIIGDFDLSRDTTGEIASIKRNGDAILENKYDPAGRLTKATGKFQGKTYSAIMDYDLFSRKSSVTHSTGMTSNYSYDDLNRIISITHNGGGEAFSEDLTYDPLTGNISNVVREFGAFAYSYDETDQIASSSYSGSLSLPSEIINRNFTHDYAGNRTSQNTASKRNVLIGSEGYAAYPDIYGSGRVYQRYYDERWDQVRENFDYAPDGKLLVFEKQADYNKTTVTHVYDPFRRRIAKLFNAGGSTYTNSYLHEGLSDKVIVSRNGVGAETLFIDGQGVDEHLGQIDTAPKAFVTDHLGSVLNGPNSQNSKSFGVFGERMENVPLLGPAQPALTYAFAGREIEPESKCLYYNRARHYDSCSGRFIQEDPIALEGGDTNLYRYVFNIPTNSVDPSGLLVYNYTGREIPETVKNSAYYKLFSQSETNHVFFGKGQLNTAAEITKYQQRKEDEFTYGITTMIGGDSSLNHIAIDYKVHDITGESVSDTMIHELGHAFSNSYLNFLPSFINDPEGKFDHKYVPGCDL